MRSQARLSPPSTQQQRSLCRPIGLLTASALAVLSACGGGGGGGSETAAPTPTQPVANVTLAGVVAVGRALGNATVRVKCAAGAATTTTNATSGAYSVEVPAATLPCAVSATSSDGATVLHSVANPSGGNSQTVNINPLTELLVAQLAAQAPATFFGAFDAASAARVTAASISTAATQVVALVRQGGVDFTAVGNPITAPLVAATATSTGNAYDQALDALGAKLQAASTTLPQLAAQVAAAAAPAPATGAVAGLPPALLLQPASPTCAALRSGTYRIVNPDDTDPAWATHVVQINAVTGVITFHDGTSDTFTATGNCTFKNDANGLRGVVSPAGVAVWTSLTNNGRQTMALSFPEQPATLADLAGNWSVLEFNNIQDQTPTPLWVNDFTQVEFAADGRHLSARDCPGLQACTAQPGPFGTVRVSAQGGLDYVDVDGQGARLFIYRPASGDPMLVALRGNDFLAIGSKPKAVATRPLGDTWGIWGLSMVSNGTAASTFSDVDYRVSAVDTATQSYTRQAVADGNSQVFTVNKPRDGLIYRAAGTSTLTTGQVSNFGDLIVMPLAGTGVSVYGVVTTTNTRNQGAFGFAVTKP